MDDFQVVYGGEAYARKEKISLEYSKNAILTAWIHEPFDNQTRDCRRPAILVIPGGGYEIVVDKEKVPVVMRYFANGYQCFSLNYSVGEAARDYAPLMEVCEAIAYIRKHAEEFDVIPDQLIVCGFSAGAHLAGCSGMLCDLPEVYERLKLTPEEIRPNGLILGYPVITSGDYTYPGVYEMLTGKAGDSEENQVFSLEKQVNENTPPCFIWTTFDDHLVSPMNTVKLIQALQKQGIPYEAHIFDHGLHGMSTCTPDVGENDPHVGKWINLSLEWISRLFNEKNVL